MLLWGESGLSGAMIDACIHLPLMTSMQFDVIIIISTIHFAVYK